MDAIATNVDLVGLAEQLSLFAGLKVFVSAGDICIDSTPYDQERALVIRAVKSRQLEFYSGRHYARLALNQAGYPSVPILRGDKGNPLWPQGVKGSITHDQQQVIVAVICDGVLKGIGIDLVKKPASVESNLQPLIASEAELQQLASAFPLVSSLALAFSLKESVVKAVSPSIDHYLDLMDIHLSFDEGCLVARLPRLDVMLMCTFFELGESLVTFAVL